MKQKRRLIINLLNFTNAQIAGVGVFTRNLLSTWLNESPPQAEIVIYAVENVNVAEIFNLPVRKNIAYKKVALHNFWIRIFYEQCILPFKLRRNDVYFSPTPVMPFLSNFITPQAKIIITIHDMIPFFFPAKYGKLRSLYVKAISKYGSRCAQTVITVSQNSKHDICTIASVKPDKVHVVYNFITGQHKQNNVEDAHYFVCISTIEPGKNLENTLRGFSAFLNRYKALQHYKLIWIGKIGWGYTWETINALVSALNIHNNVKFTGYISEEEKTSLISNASALLYLSYYEGFGLPVLESLYQNKPSIVANKSSLPEVIGQAGIACDPESIDDISAALYTMIEQRKMYVQNIPMQIQKFSKTVQVQRFAKIIDL